MRSAASGRRSSGKPRSRSSRSPRRIVEPSPVNDASPSLRSGIKHILVCVDGTDRDRSVLDQALQIALRFDSHIDVLHVRFDVHGTTSEPAASATVPAGAWMEYLVMSLSPMCEPAGRWERAAKLRCRETGL